MQLSIPISVPAFRQPEYTGENRCVPCTILNAAITIIAGIVVFAVAVSESVLLGLSTSSVVLIAGTILIYYRGYLIPGTPQFTRRYLPNRVLSWFNKSPTPQDIEPEYVLRDLGAIEECEEADDLCLTDTFEKQWWDRMRSLQNTDTTHKDLADILNVTMGEISVSTHDDDAITATMNGQKIGQWESRAVLIADVAAAKEFASRGNSLWHSLRTDQQGTVLNGLRAFLDRCPACEGQIEFGSEAGLSCCQLMEVVASSCVECGARIFEVETPK